MYCINVDMSPRYHKSNEVLCGIENIVFAIKETINKAKTRYDACVDSSIPSFIVKKGIIGNLIEFKYKRDGQIRYITEVTNENLDYCKQIMNVAELRHLQGLKGVFRVNEIECHHNIILDEQNQMAMMVCSNINELVSQYQKVFDTLWEKAIPFKDRMSQIEAIEVKNLTNKGLNSQVTSKKKNSSSQQPSTKIQLWSNESKTNYAIKLSNQGEFLVATSSPTEKYTDLIEESDYLEDIQYNWEYTLSHWINTKR